MAKNDRSTSFNPSGCFVKSMGCAATTLLLPVCLIIFGGWFTIGPMGCSLPNRCSKAEETAKGLFAMGVLLEAVFGTPIATGILLSRAVQNSRRQ